MSACDPLECPFLARCCPCSPQTSEFLLNVGLAEGSTGSTRPILLKNSVLTDAEKNLALMGREGHIRLGDDQDELISQRRASPLLQKRKGAGIFNRIHICRKFDDLAISRFSTE